MLLTCVLFLEVTFQLIQGSTIKTSCNDYIPTLRTTYKIFQTPRTWNQAKADCEKEESILFYPQDRNEASAILNYYQCESQADIFRNIFIGVADWIVEDIFVTVDGKPILDIYNDWLPNEPKNGGKNGCAIMQWDGHLKVESCNTPHRYICKKLETSKYDFSCGLDASGYRYYNMMNSCYKFHLTPRNWTDAFDTCNAEGSHLAVIDSIKEADHLVSITASANTEKVKGDHVKGAIYIGITKEEVTSLQDRGVFEWEPSSVTAKNKKKWVTVTKGALEDSGYNNWGISHRLRQNANCGAMFPNGLLTAIECHHKMFFICEHDRSGAMFFPSY